MYKCINGLAPRYLCDIFISNNNSYNTRNASQLKLHKTRIAYSQCSFNVSSLKLPFEIKNSHSDLTFKRNLHKYVSDELPCLLHIVLICFMYAIIILFLFYLFYFFAFYLSTYLLAYILTCILPTYINTCCMIGVTDV